jgi:hypothetical protein
MSAYPKPLTGLTRPIPTEALAVVAILRRDVPRPKTLPTLPIVGRENHRTQLAWRDREYNCCAAGLAPKAMSGFPGGAISFGYANEGITNKHVEAFTMWFDSQVNAQEVVDAIWPLTKG